MVENNWGVAISFLQTQNKRPFFRQSYIHFSKLNNSYYAILYSSFTLSHIHINLKGFYFIREAIKVLTQTEGVIKRTEGAML